MYGIDLTNARNLFKSSLRGTVHVSLLNAEVIKTSLVFWIIFVLPDFLIGGLALFRPQRVWWLILSLFGKDRGLVFRVPGWSLELGLDQRLTLFSKESNEVGLFWSSVSIKLDGLRMLEVRRLIINFFLLVLGVLLNSTPGSVYQSTRVTKTFPKKSLNSTQGKWALAAWFWHLCWCKEDKAVTVRLKPVALTICIEIIFTLLVGPRVWDNWLEPGGTNLCRTCYHLKVFLSVPDKSWGRD